MAAPAGFELQEPLRSRSRCHRRDELVELEEEWGVAGCVVLRGVGVVPHDGPVENPSGSLDRLIYERCGQVGGEAVGVGRGERSRERPSISAPNTSPVTVHTTRCPPMAASRKS